MKKLSKLAIIMLLVVSVVACSSKTKKNENEITVWAWDETFNIAAVKEAASVYAKVNADTKINVVTMSQADIVQKLHTSLSSGKIDGLPDIVLIEDYKIQNYLTAYEDSFADLSKIVDKDAFDAYKFSTNSINGKIYGVPFDSGVAALFYRRDLIEEAGYTMADMENITWEQYIDIAKKVKEKTGKAMLTLDPNDVGQIRMMMQSAGAWYMKEDGKTVDLENNQALKDAITVYKAMMEANISKQVSDWDSFVSAFQQGDVVSVPTGCWIASSITSAKDLSGKWAVAALPRLGANKNSVNASSIGGAGWYVINNENAEKSKDFLKNTFATDAELMNTLASKINLVSTLKAASTTSNYVAENPFFSNQPTLKMLSEWSGKVPSVNYGLHTYAIESVVAEAVQSILNGADMDATLKNAQKQAEAAVVE